MQCRFNFLIIFFWQPHSRLHVATCHVPYSQWGLLVYPLNFLHCLSSVGKGECSYFIINAVFSFLQFTACSSGLYPLGGLVIPGGSIIQPLVIIVNYGIALDCWTNHWKNSPARNKKHLDSRLLRMQHLTDPGGANLFTRLSSYSSSPWLMSSFQGGCLSNTGQRESDLIFSWCYKHVEFISKSELNLLIFIRHLTSEN
mgnify:CR=1 FL=1